MRGVEALVVSRAVSKSADAIGGGNAARRLVREVLGALTLPGGPDQPPKAKRAQSQELINIVGDRSRAERMLASLQSDEVIRPAEGTGAESAWRLDHDYLARAVLAERRMADRWAVALREGKARFDEAGDDWRQRWAALLPIGTSLRVAWESLRGRLNMGEALHYARMSFIKPVAACVLAMGVGFSAVLLERDLRIDREAAAIFNRLANQSEKDSAALEVWRAPMDVRQRLRAYIIESPSKLETAGGTRWALAHAGVESIRAREAAEAFRTLLSNTRSVGNPGNAAHAYAALIVKVNDQSELKVGAIALRERLVKTTDNNLAIELGEAYGTVASKLNDQAELKVGATALREKIADADGDLLSKIGEAYGTVASKLSDQIELKAQASALRERLIGTTAYDLADKLGTAYGAVTSNLNDQSELKAGATVLRELLLKVSSVLMARGLIEAYGAVASKLTDQSELKAHASVIRGRRRTAIAPASLAQPMVQWLRI